MTAWVTDATRFTALSRENVFENRSIRDFLTGDRIFWIVASKGMGKTLLLRYKRDLMESERAASGVLILPQNKSLDYVRLPNNLPIESTDAMQDRSFWKDCWEMSITLSILLSFPFQELSSGYGNEAAVLLRDLRVPALMRDKVARRLKRRPARAYEQDMNSLLQDVLAVAWSLGKPCNEPPGEVYL